MPHLLKRKKENVISTVLGLSQLQLHSWKQNVYIIIILLLHCKLTNKNSQLHILVSPFLIRWVHSCRRVYRVFLSNRCCHCCDRWDGIHFMDNWHQWVVKLHFTPLLNHPFPHPLFREYPTHATHSTLHIHFQVWREQSCNSDNHMYWLNIHHNFAM